MINKQKKVDIYSQLKQIQEYSEEKRLRPSKILEDYDLQKKNHLNFNEFESMLKSILTSQYHNTIRYVWDFITIQTEQTNHVTGEMFDSIVQLLYEIDDRAYFQVVIDVKSKLKQQKKQKKTKQGTSRCPKKIFKIISKQIQDKETMEKMFNIYDEDQDKQLNIHELKNFFDNLVSGITTLEFEQIISYLNIPVGKDLKVDLLQLIGLIQNDKAKIKLNLIEVKKTPPKEVEGKKQSLIQYVINKIYYTFVKKEEQLNNTQVGQDITQQQQLNHNEPLNQHHNVIESIINFQEHQIEDVNTPGFSSYMITFQNLKEQNQQYLDQKFPAHQDSLGGNLNVKVQAWMRPKDIWQDNTFDLFMKELVNTRTGIGKWISPSDIKQGKLGDCYFLAAISAIACRRPDCLLDLFVTQKINHCGMFCVRMNIDGQWQAITVDEFFPTRKTKPIFTQGKSGQIWVMVLEKVWAKIFGSYQNIVSGYETESLRALTGAPTIKLMTIGKAFLQDLEKYCQEKCIMVCQSQSLIKSGLTRSEVKKIGLVYGHAYSIHKVKDIIHPKLGEVKLLKLRNPWAKKEWEYYYSIYHLRGDWSEKSDLWTPELKEQLKYNNLKEGVFYMDVSSFIQHFRKISVCLLRPNYKYSSEQIISTKKKSTYLTIQIMTPGEYFFTVNQQNKRFKEAQKYSPIRILVGQKLKSGQYKLVTSCNKQAKREIWCTSQFKAGSYVIQIKTNWQFKEENTFTFSSYGQEKVVIHQVPKIPDLIRSMFMIIAQKRSKKTSQYTAPKVKQFCKFKPKLGHGYFYTENRSQNYFESTVEFNDSYGIKLCKPERDLFIKISLGVGESQLSIFTISHKGFSQSFTQQIQQQ